MNLAEKFYSETDYLELERKSKIKNEYFRGEVFAMAGASVLHNRIVSNIIGSLHQLLKNKPCEEFPSDLRVKVEKFQFYTYPDITIVCGNPELQKGEFDTLLNPTVLIEVLSDSTEKYDRGQKFSLYREIPSLQEYILVSTKERKLEKYKRMEKGSWLFSESQEGELFYIDSIDSYLNLDDVYEKVDWSHVKNTWRT